MSGNPFGAATFGGLPHGRPGGLLKK